MSGTQPWQSAVEQLVRELRALYGQRLDRVLLYGSRARRQADDESDVDVLVLIRQMGEFWAEFSRIAPVADRISLEHDVVLSVIPADADGFAGSAAPLSTSIRREGVVVG